MTRPEVIELFAVVGAAFANWPIHRFGREEQRIALDAWTAILASADVAAVKEVTLELLGSNREFAPPPGLICSQAMALAERRKRESEATRIPAIAKEYAVKAPLLADGRIDFQAVYASLTEDPEVRAMKTHRPLWQFAAAAVHQAQGHRTLSGKGN